MRQLMFGAKTDTFVCMQISFDDGMANAIDKMWYENERIADNGDAGAALLTASVQPINKNHIYIFIAIDEQ